MPSCYQGWLDTAVIARKATSQRYVGAGSSARFQHHEARRHTASEKHRRQVAIYLMLLSWGYLFGHLETNAEFRPSQAVMPLATRFFVTGIPWIMSPTPFGLRFPPFPRSSDFMPATYAPILQKCRTLNRDMLPVQPSNCNKWNKMHGSSDPARTAWGAER